MWDGPVVIVGIGELGSVFARGLLRAGRPVYPVTRSMRAGDLVDGVSDPALVLIAVGEDELGPVLRSVPEVWRDRVGLLQNELLPCDWREHSIERPTVAVVWFEKKPARPLHELLPTAVFGPQAPLLADALSRVGVTVRLLDSERELLLELVQKNLYILTTNIAGLSTGGSVRQLWEEHRDLAVRVARDVIVLQARRSGVTLPEPDLMAALERAIDADPDHQATGRSAPRRLERALEQARALGISLPCLGSIASDRG